MKKELLLAITAICSIVMITACATEDNPPVDMPGDTWYGFLTAYIIEMVAIFVLHKTTHAKFELTENKQ